MPGRARRARRALLDLGRLALADPVVAAAAALPAVTVPGIGTYENRNLIVGVDGVTGLKTGTLIEADATLATHEGLWVRSRHPVAGQCSFAYRGCFVSVVRCARAGPPESHIAFFNTLCFCL